MNWRGRLYQLGRRYLTFPDWESYYDEIVSGGAELEDRFLRQLLDHASIHVPYYARTLPRERRQQLDYSSVLRLTKSLLRENFDQFKSADLHARKWFANSSGGSTGTPQTFLQDREFVQWSIAAKTYFHRELLGVDDVLTPKVVLWGSEREIFRNSIGIKPKISNWLTQTTFLNSFRMTPQTSEEYVGVINRVRPVFVKGYAGSLYALAKLIKQHNWKVHQPQFVYSSAETLRPFMRQAIEEVFNCQVHDFYGSREVGTMAGECRKGKLHVFTFNNRVEVVDADDRPVGPGEEGRLLITTLHNHAMPLIRYEIGDTAIKGTPCACGSELPTLEKVTGRVTDHFVTKDNTLVHGEYFTHLFYFRDWCDEFQVLQKDVEEIEVYYVAKSPPLAQDQAEIAEKTRLVMGPDCRISWHEVERIPRTPHGKLLFTRSLVTEEKKVA